ncbi:hypothetical protein [uncultured Flavobacterium sp.]|uniref:hypothetical protein n=1 Tax=uncultured Flavobacterium sp. TaxID=165435 RepID=UPI0025E4C599|nr:hypothetical protein [uncultured Flavobacterium sp.]
MKIGYVAVLLLLFGTLNAQSISSEVINFQLLQEPKELVEAKSRNFKVTVTSPYNLTAADVVKKAKADHQQALKDYDGVVLASQEEFKQKTKDYDAEVATAKQKFETESAEFKKLSMLERLAMTDQGKNPKMVTPAKPVYVKPQPPVYREPNLNDYTIVDNNVLASQINITGFTKGAGYVDIALDIKAVNFQDNAGQTFANQPTKLVVKVNGVEKVNTTFFEEYTFLSSSPSNNINKPLEEKNHLAKVMAFVNNYLNDTFGFQPVKKSVKIQSVKNKGKYDELERADIYVKTNLKKLQPVISESNTAAYAAMQKGIDIWVDTLGKVEYKNNKADMNADIAEFIYFNLIRLNIALGRKADAEKYLNQFQENLIYIKLNYDEKNELKQLEDQIYNAK